MTSLTDFIITIEDQETMSTFFLFSWVRLGTEINYIINIPLMAEKLGEAAEACV